jgi:hypothetical protein
MMKGIFTTRRFLTDILVWVVIFTIFALGVLIPFRPLHAADNNDPTPPVITSTTNAQNEQDTPLDADDKSYRTHQLMHYIHDQLPNWLPGVPSYIRDPAGWALGGARQIRDEIGLERTADGSPSMMASLAQPMAAMMQPPTPQQAEAMWLSPDYHHMGFLPAHDAMVMGVGARHTVWGGTQLEVRPFYGQNWHSLEGYGGSEAAINLGGANVGHPWGKIAVRYIEGSSDMLDHGHGTDMHAEVHFNQQLALHAGVRQSDNSELGNYVLLRWQLAELGHANH